MDVRKQVLQIDWSDYESAYGIATKTGAYSDVSLNLQLLFSDDHAEAMKASHHLWSSLCHQHAYVSSAALPAYDFLLYGLKTLADDLKVELLDIFLGFATCTGDALDEASWKGQLRKKLSQDKAVFQTLITHANSDIAWFAEAVCAAL